MNFKTTIVLLILVAAVGGYLWFTRDTGTSSQETKVEDHRVLDVKKDDVTRVTITPADGKPIVLEKSTEPAPPASSSTFGTSKWRMTQPVAAEADPFEVSSLVDTLTTLHSTARVPAGDAVRTGLDHPQYKVTLTAGGKDATLLVGDRLAATGGVYVKPEGAEGAGDVVASDFLDRLEKPANSFRQPKLVDATNTDIKQVRITRKDGPELKLRKAGENWEIQTNGQTMPAETSDVTALLTSLTGLRAAEFVDSDSSQPAAGPERAMMTIWYSTAAPATQSSTAPATQEAGNTLSFDGYEDIRKERVIVSVPGTNTVALVDASSLDAFKKTPLELRDKRVVTIKPDEVSAIAVSAELRATTQPTTRPASKREVSIARRMVAPPMLGPVMPMPVTTKAATHPATGVATTKPAAPAPTKWEIISEPKGDAVDSNVDALLNDLNPLKADKFIEGASATIQPADHYVITVTTQGAGGAAMTNYEIRFADPGNEKPLIGEYNGLRFEAPRTILKSIEADFRKPHPSTTKP